MTLIATVFLMFRRRISLGNRKMLMQTTGGIQISDIIKIVKRAIAVTAAFELLGAIVLFLRLCSFELSPMRAAYFAVFHSVSAFCNAGFDIMSGIGSASFSAFSGDIVVNITLIVLIISGGLGFLVWSNIFSSRFKPSRFELHTKIVLTASAVLILGGTLIFYLTERNHAFSGQSGGEKLLSALFHSVSLRTAGFFTADMSTLSEGGSLLSCVFMLIGGSPGSTAGGIKTTTFIMLIAATVSCIRNRSGTIIFKRKINEDTIRQAMAIVFIYVFAAVGSCAVICAIEGIGMREVLFEVTSAIGTVGLSQNLTATLSNASQYIIMFLMYAGRLGGLSLVLALAEKRVRIPTDRPLGKILIG